VVHSIGARLKVWRDALLLKQAEAAATLGLSGSTYQNYERDVRAPNTEGWEAFVRAGINANWLLTGEGPMLLADLTRSPAGALDMERLQMAIEATEEGLRAAKREMTPSKKAELILAVYDLLEESSVSKERVLKLVKFAA
jgi:transcriptional regulator with XRE-family HTH domain